MNTYARSNKPVLLRSIEPSQYLCIRYSERLDGTTSSPPWGREAIPTTVSIIHVLGSAGDDTGWLPSGCRLTRAYDWPVCLRVDLSAMARRRSTQRRLAARAVTE
jgi:hypothetical protein